MRLDAALCLDPFLYSLALPYICQDVNSLLHMGLLLSYMRLSSWDWVKVTFLSRLFCEVFGHSNESSQASLEDILDVLWAGVCGPYYLDGFRDITNSSWVQPDETGHFISNGFCILEPTIYRGLGVVAAPAGTFFTVTEEPEGNTQLEGFRSTLYYRYLNVLLVGK